VEVLRAALDLGIQPSDATLRALLACCADLESRPGKSPLGFAAGPGFRLDSVGYVDLGQVLAACKQALQGQGEQQQEQEQGVGLSAVEAAVDSAGGWGDVVSSMADADGTSSSSSSSGSSSSTEARRLAAQLLRAWVFNATFTYVEGVRSHGPTWPLKGASAGAADTAEVSAAAIGV
jgi:hypothetical protein